MAEYIEREAVERFIAEGLNNPDKSKAYGYDAVEILAEVHCMDAADVVEVVRCKECKHFHKYKSSKPTLWGELWGKCTLINMDIDIKVNDFCSYGERKE